MAEEDGSSATRNTHKEEKVEQEQDMPQRMPAAARRGEGEREAAAAAAAQPADVAAPDATESRWDGA